MKKYLVIGNPIKHSLSPELHNYWIEQNHIDAIYEKKELNHNELKNLILNIKKENMKTLTNKIDFWEGESWNSDPKDFVWTYGFGPRFIFLGLPFKLDYGWEYHPTRKSNRMWYLSVGLDY